MVNHRCFCWIQNLFLQDLTFYFKGDMKSGSGGVKRWLKKYHKWVSIVCAFFILLFAVSGIVMNHRATFGGVDISRSYLPDSYQYSNWNLGAIKGGLKVDSSKVVVYGNIGVWLTDSCFSYFKDLNRGFPEGIDNRKITSLAVNSKGDLLAGTLFGLYKRAKGEEIWKKLAIPSDEKRVVKVLQLTDKLFVMTRSDLLMSIDDGKSFHTIILPSIFNENPTTGLFRLTWIVHSGEILGIPGKLLVDLVGIVFILLTITGLIFFITPNVIKRLSIRMKRRWAKLAGFSLRWHNHLGTWMFAFLTVTTLTGMFLRPPLLISIAGVQFETEDENKMHIWDDKLRDILYDTEQSRFIIATTDGLFYTNIHFKQKLQRFKCQPPVSVMGITVFKKVADGHFLTGSFSGLFDWFPEKGLVIDRMTGLPPDQKLLNGPPIGNVSVSGFYERISGSFIVFDYGRGAIMSEPGLIGSMPADVLKKSPMSLWNLSLEIHTARIWEPLIGGFYILIVPLSGFFILFSLISGLWLWFLAKKNRKRIL